MNNNTFVHKYIKSLLKPEYISVDMTLGNGNDTELLCKLTSKVYGFDINEEAINNSKNRLCNYHNIEYILDNHINVDKYIKDNIDFAIFNLGYLPHSESNIITKADETLISFKKVYDLLNPKRYVVITFYIGHQGGKDEYYLLDKYLKENRFHIIETYSQNKINSPITYIIKKP